VDRGARVFWTLVTVLAGASVFFAVGAVRRQQELKHSDVELHTGDVVELVRAIDGDTVVVRDGAGNEVTVRILGIKAFEPQPERDEVARFGRSAMDAIQELAKNQSLRLMVHSTPQDTHGRTLATLYAGDADVGLELVKRGLGMVYTPYPFPALSVYLSAQAEARGAHRGLWSDPAAANRAAALAHEWGSRAP
jgi:micrococcal nuclease